MSSGTKTIGTVNGTPYYYTKTWNGGDGKYNSAGELNQHAYTMSNTVSHAVKNAGTFYDIPVASFTKTVALSSNDTVAAQNRLVQAIKTHEFNLAVSLGQMNETTAMICQTAHRLRKSFTQLKRGNLRSAALALGADPRKGKRDSVTISPSDVPSAWLELQYGWLPLLGDAHAAGEALASLTDPPRRTVVRSSFTRKWSKQTVVNSSWTKWTDEKIRLSYIVYLKESMSAPRSLGLLDPLSVAWELCPYSFVVDWFLPYGTYLENLNAIPHISGTIVTTDAWELTGLGIGNIKSATAFYGESRDIRRCSVSRTVSTTLPVAKPVFELPGRGNLSRFYNAASLLSNAFRL